MNSENPVTDIDVTKREVSSFVLILKACFVQSVDKISLQDNDIYFLNLHLL